MPGSQKWFLGWKTRLQKEPDYFWLVLLVVFIAGLNLIWTLWETRPPHWDMGRHLTNSLLYLQDFRAHNLFGLLGSYRYYPPLLYYLTIPFYLVFGTSIPVAVLTNILFEAVLAYSIYGIGRTLWNRRVAWLSVALVFSYPIMVSQFKEYQLDAPLTAMVALSLLLLIKSEGFTKRPYTLALGIVAGLSLLTKWTYPLALIVPFLAALVHMIQYIQQKKDWRPVSNLFWAGMLAYFIAAYWYIVNRHALHVDLSFNSSAAAKGGSGPVGLASSLWYFWNFLNVQAYLLPALLFAIGFLVSLFKRRFLIRNSYPLLLVVGTYLVFSHLGNKDARYTMPMLVGTALISASTIELLIGRARDWVTGIIIFYSIAAFLIISFGLKGFPNDITIPTGHTHSVEVFGQHGYIIGPPSGQQWYQQQIVQSIAKMKPGASVVDLGPNPIWFNDWGFRYYDLRFGLNHVDTVAEAEYVVWQSGDSTVPAPTGLRELQHYHLPDGSQAIIYTSS